MMCYPLASPSKEQVDNGVACVTARDFRWEKCHIKSTSLLGNVLARQISADVGAIETILLRDGFLTEASASNVFVVKDGVVVAPPRDNLILLGITYDLLVKLARRGHGEARGPPDHRGRAARAPTRSGSRPPPRKCSRSPRSTASPWATASPGPVFRRMHALFQDYKAKLREQARRRLSRASRPHLRGMKRPWPAREPESLLTFPCVFPIKVMGRREDGFAQTISDDRAAPRARLPSRDDRDAHVEATAATSRSRSRINAQVARAARRPLLGALEASDGDDGAVIVRRLGLVAYEPTWRAMQAFNAARAPDTADQLWLVEHPPVFTLGLAGRREHVLAPGDIPVVATDRGGQVTYHGPGQAVAYVLLDLRRAGHRREGAGAPPRAGGASTCSRATASTGERRAGMPGVYVGGAKIAAIGLRVARGCTYHGVALNVDLDLEPFARIDPCGYPGLASTSLADLGVRDRIDAVQQQLARRHPRDA